METYAHQQLKILALGFLLRIGCLARAEEVRCPISRYRVDAAGYADRRPGRRSRNETEFCSPSLESLYGQAHSTRSPFCCEPRTIMIECKQSRGDFLRDNRRMERLLALRRDLEGLRCSIEEHQIKRFEPQLRREGSSLFVELDEWDFKASELPAYRQTMRKLRRVERKLFGETKFHMIARYQLADRLFIAAPRGLIRPGELPLGWGLLECPRECLHEDQDDPALRFNEEPVLKVRAKASELSSQDIHRQRLLRNIAVAASFAAAETRARRENADGQRPLKATCPSSGGTTGFGRG